MIMEQCPRCGGMGEYQSTDMEHDYSVFGETIEYRERYTCLECGREWDEVHTERVYGDDIYMW